MGAGTNQEEEAGIFCLCGLFLHSLVPDNRVAIQVSLPRTEASSLRTASSGLFVFLEKFPSYSESQLGPPQETHGGPCLEGRRPGVRVAESRHTMWTPGAGEAHWGMACHLPF